MEISYLALRKIARRMRKPPGSSSSQDEDPSYQLDFQDLTLNPNLLQASLPTRSTEAPFPGPKFVVVTEAQEMTLHSLGINLRPRSFTKDCDICTDTFPLSAFMSAKGCPHEYCFDCCKRHAEAKLTSGSLQMECPDPSCTHSFTMDQCRTLFSKSNFTTLNIRLTETAIPASLRVYCPFKDCSVFMEKSESGGTFAECYFCHREFCQACNVPWHNNQTCGEYRANEMNSRLSGDQKFRELAKQQKWQTCPDCKSFVERTEGCKHMTCVSGHIPLSIGTPLQGKFASMPGIFGTRSLGWIAKRMSKSSKKKKSDEAADEALAWELQDEELAHELQFHELNPDFSQNFVREFEESLMFQASSSASTSNSKTPYPGCAHEYCSGCCQNHAEAKIMSGSTQIKCPEGTCAHHYDMEQCHQLLSDSSFDALNVRLTEAAIPAALKVFCPFVDCSAFMEKSATIDVAVEPFAECYACHRGFCLECNVPWHAGQTCGERRASEINNKLSGDSKLRDLAKQKKWQQCPDCNRVIDLLRGCNHMTCLCGLEFCYVCGAKWKNKAATCQCSLWDETRIIHH